MKTPAFNVRPSISAVIVSEVVVIAALVALPPHRAGWWPAVLAGAVAVIALMPTVYRRNMVAWTLAALRWRRHRRAGVAAAAAIDVPQGDSLCGVRVEGGEAITMVSVTGLAYAPTLLRGATVAHTPNVLPLGILAGLLDQPGSLHLASIDVVSAGLRVRRGTGYPPLYSTLLADRPAAGQRSTRLIVRLDITKSVPGLTYRSSIGAAAAAATERIVNGLLQEGIRASALSAHQLDAALAELGARLAAAPEPDGAAAASGRRASGGAAGVGAARNSGRSVRNGSRSALRGGRSGSRGAGTAEVGWRNVNAHPGHLTTYYFSPEDITTAALNQVWALRTDDVVQTVTLGRCPDANRNGAGPVRVSATVRCNDPQRPPQPPTLYLNTLPGDQQAATLSAAPIARPGLRLPTRPLDDAAALAIPIGPTGVLVGTAVHDDPKLGCLSDDLVMLALTDPQRATRIAMDTSSFYARQLLLRAAAVGERIVIYTDGPQGWAALSQPYIAVVDRSRPPQFVPSIIVSDRPGAAPAAGLASTVITLGRAAIDGHTPDLVFTQMSRSIVRITAPTFETDVAIAAFRQEQAWTG
ncbi:MAG TPA: type VII secretion protein EccE [Mycobacterium sp.]|nr:type VII secretion protein EccE [Mycobacterium sp.]HZA12297.1 type VII secretion protein EccE [Mycobacterium sp.]